MTEETKPCPLQPIDTAIDGLTYFKDYLDTAFLSLQNKIDSAGANAQEIVDEYIENEINPYINAKLAEWRSSLLSCLQDMYKKYQDCLQPAGDIMDFGISADLTKIVEFLNLIKDFITKAYESLMGFLALFPPHLVRLTSAITELVTYTPPISVSGISFSKLNIQCEPITMDDITGGAS